MVVWAVNEGVIEAVGRDGEVSVQTAKWRPRAPESPLPYPIDAAVAGSTTRLRLPPGRATITDGTGAVASSGRLDAEEYLLSVDASVETLARFRGPATVETNGDGAVLAFPDERTVSLGFREEQPELPTVSVPRTPSGLATAVTVAGETIADTGPARSHPSQRVHPPLVEFDDAATPRVGAATGRDSGLVFRVPDDLEHVLVASPLAYYLGAELVAEQRTTPLLTAEPLGFERPFGALPAFATEIAAACRRVFHLDCLSRDLPFEEPPDRSLLAELGLEAEQIREVSPAVRYATFLDAPLDVVDGRLPKWHLSTYVDATYERARSLPYLLDRLSLIYPAEASEMEPRDLLESSLDDFYRGEVVSVTPVSPDLGVGRAHAWLADGEPVDAFKTSTAAHEQRLTSGGASGEMVDIEVVLNDPEMDAELAVADIYRNQASALPVSVTVHESLTTDELAALFERPSDFVHYVGHCEVDGLRCPDGHLSASSLDASRARTFFLNACGSYREGETLVQKGSVAGGVTLDRVLNEQAATVGTAFARLVVNGFGIDRALSLARRRIMMGKDYAVVGDGTFALTPACGDPAVLTVERNGDGFAVSYAVNSTRAAGASFVDPFDGTTRLYGTNAATTLDRQQLAEFLSARSVPVMFEGDLRWSDELAAGLEFTRGAHRA